MTSPAHGDLLIRCVEGQYIIAEVGTGVALEAPFEKLSHAIGMAHSRALPRHSRVWTERTDTTGATFGPPLLLPPAIN